MEIARRKVATSPLAGKWRTSNTTAATSFRMPTGVGVEQSAPLPSNWAPGILVDQVWPEKCRFGGWLSGYPLSKLHLDLFACAEWDSLVRVSENDLNRILIITYGQPEVDATSGSMRLIDENEDAVRQSVHHIEQSLPIAQRIKHIESRLQLTRSQLAKALRVERATMYQWFHGSHPRSAGTLTRIEQLNDFALAWHNSGLGSAKPYWYFRTSNGDLTLGEMLMEEHLDNPRLFDFITQMRDVPDSVQMVEPGGSFGFPAEDAVEEQRRRNEHFPRTYSES
jgi:transcriptional regulator with XRE-family HTH domain